MKCTFCGDEMVNKKELCPFCGKHKVDNCAFCKNTGKLTVVRCNNNGCELPDHNLEPWDED